METPNNDNSSFKAEMTRLMNEGQADEAVKQIAARITDNPHDDSLHYLIGNAYRRQSNWQKALEHYAEAIELNSDSPARQAKTMLMDILNYRCKDLLNP